MEFVSYFFDFVLHCFLHYFLRLNVHVIFAIFSVIALYECLLVNRLLILCFAHEFAILSSFYARDCFGWDCMMIFVIVLSLSSYLLW